MQMTAVEKTIGKHEYAGMLRKPVSYEPYYPAELVHLEKDLIAYRFRKRVGICNCCTSPVEYQIYDPRRRMFFDHCTICKHTDRV